MRVGSWLVCLALVAAGASAETGTLAIRTQAGVHVEWEGVSLGTTDERGHFEIAGIPPGEYELEFSKEGFESHATAIEIEAGPNSLLLELAAVEAPRPVEPRAAPEPVIRTQTPAPQLEAPDLPRQPVLEPPAPVAAEPAPRGSAAGPPAPAAEPAAPPPTALRTPGAAPDLKASDQTPAPPAPAETRTLSSTPFIVGLGILAAGAFLAARRRPLDPAARRLLAAGEEVPPPPPEPEPAPSPPPEPPVFLDDLKKRETTLENFADADGGSVQRRIVDVEVVDMGPIEAAAEGAPESVGPDDEAPEPEPPASDGPAEDDEDAS